MQSGCSRGLSWLCGLLKLSWPSGGYPVSRAGGESSLPFISQSLEAGSSWREAQACRRELSPAQERGGLRCEPPAALGSWGSDCWFSTEAGQCPYTGSPAVWPRDRFPERGFFHGPGLGRMVSAWFKHAELTVHFISNLQLLPMWPEAQSVARRLGTLAPSISASVHAAAVLLSWPTLCGPTDCRPPGFSVHGIFPARKMRWFAISFSKLYPCQGVIHVF